MADRYLVTGGGGFIGSHLVRALLERGDAVRVLDDFSTGRRTNLAAVEHDIDLRIGSILDHDTLSSAMNGIDYVLHQAALPSVSRSVARPRDSHEVNATGTLNVLLAARDAGVRKVVYAASSSVYGNSPTMPRHEELPTQPLSPYASAKLAGENYCRAIHHVYGLPTVMLRYFNIFGPGQDPDSPYSAVIPRFITALLRGEPPQINGDGTQSRDFTYVANAVHANLLACAADERANGNVMNIACGGAYSLLELMGNLCEILDTQIEPVFGPERPGDVRHSCASIERAKELIGYTPAVAFRAGLEATVASFQLASVL